MGEQFDLSDSDLLEEEEPDFRHMDMQAQVAEVERHFQGDVVDVKCKMYKIEKGGRGWLFDAQPIELSDVQNTLKNEYGPGIYENHVYINGRLNQRLKLEIGATLADKFPQRLQQGDQGLKSGDILQLVREMQANQAEQTKLMMERFETTIIKAMPQASAQPAPVNPTDMMANMMGVMMQMKEFLGNKTEKDPIAEFTRYMTAFTEMQALSGEGGSGPMLAGLAKEFLPKLADLAKISASAPNPNPAARKSVGTPTPDQVSHMATSHTEALQTSADRLQATGQNPAQPTGDKQTMLNDFIINKALNFLIPAAARGFSPVTYAELLLDQADIYSIQQEVINFVLGDEAIEQMILINPEVANFRPWFDEMKATIQSLVTEVSDAQNEPDLTNAPNEPINLKDATLPSQSVPIAPDPERVTGNMANAGDHVEPG